jgi:PspA-Associated protein
MIVRISGEGQYEVADDQRERLNELDNKAVAAVEAGDEAKFNELWGQMLELVTNECQPLADDELVESDVILPPRDSTFEEARADFNGDGLIPD